MKKKLTLFILVLGFFIFNSCCDCNEGRITDQLDTLRSLEDTKKDVFYYELDNGSVYKLKHVSKDSIDYGEEEEEDTMETSMSSSQSFLSFFFSSAAAAPASCKTGEDCEGDIYAGRDRKQVKTSIYHGTIENFNEVKDLLNTLASDDDMRNHNPKISKACESERVAEEKRSVRIKSAYLYGIYREPDNDFHVIIGNGVWGGSGMKLMNIEISALPDDESSSDYKKLSKVRDKIIEEFGELKCHQGAFKPVDELIPISVEGSLFYDIDHAPGIVGFTSDGIKIKPKTAWEIHPVTKIIFQ